MELACYLGGVAPADIGAMVRRSVRANDGDATEIKHVIEEWMACLAFRWSPYWPSPSAD